MKLGIRSKVVLLINLKTGLVKGPHRRVFDACDDEGILLVKTLTHDDTVLSKECVWVSIFEELTDNHMD